MCLTVVLSFENNAHRARHTGYFLPKVETKDYNALIDGPNLFGQPVKKALSTYDNVQKIMIGQGGDWKTGYLLDYTYFKDNYKLIAID